MATNIETVAGIYEAFGKGDIPHILGRMRDDIVWDEGIRHTDISYLQPGRGKDHVMSFFQNLAASVEFLVFEPGAPCASGNTVMVPVREAIRNIATGKSADADTYVHIWTFDDDNMVASFRHVGDWANHEMAAEVAGAKVAAAS